MIYLFVAVFTIGGQLPTTIVYEHSSQASCIKAVDNLYEAKLPDIVEVDAFCFGVPRKTI